MPAGYERVTGVFAFSQPDLTYIELNYQMHVRYLLPSSSAAQMTAIAVGAKTTGEWTYVEWSFYRPLGRWGEVLRRVDVLGLG